MFDSTACSNFIQFDWEFFYRFVVWQTESAHYRPRHPPASTLFVVSFTCSIDLFEVKRRTHFLAFAKCAQNVRRALINIERSIFTIHAQMNSSEHSELIWISMNFVIKLWRQLLNGRDEFLSGFLIWISRISMRKARVHPLGTWDEIQRKSSIFIRNMRRVPFSLCRRRLD